MGVEVRTAAAAPWLLFAAALALRLVGLGQEPLWFDEAYTAIQASKPVTEILALLREEAGAPLYYLLLKVWSALAGDTEWALRLPSALAGAAAVPLLHRLATEMHSPRAGMIAALLAVVSPLHVHYSQEARMYAPLALLAGLALLLLHRLATAPSARCAGGLGIVLLAGLYLHYYFIFFLPVVVVAAVLAGRRAGPGMAGALTMAGLGFAPWLATLLHQTANRSTAWIGAYWRDHPLAYAVPWSLESLGPGALYPGWQTLKLYSAWGCRVVSLALALLVVAGIVRESVRAQREGRLGGALPTLAALLLPLALAFGLSLVREPVYVVARYDLIAWGPYMVAAGIVATCWRRLGLLLAAVWVTLSLFTLIPHYTTEREVRNYSDMGPSYAERLRELSRPGETVIFTAGTRTTTEYYLRGEEQDLRLVSFPPANDAHLGWVVSRAYTDPAFAERQAGRLVATLLDDPSERPVLWVTAPKSRGTDALLRHLARLGYVPDRNRSVQSLLCLARAGAPGL